MIVGVGVDIADLSRVRRALERYGDRFIERIASAEEAGLGDRRAGDAWPVERLAGLFAAKEAVLKALGTGWAAGLAPRQVVVRHDPAGRPSVHLEGAAAARLGVLGGRVIHVSISHERSYAVALAIVESREGAPA